MLTVILEASMGPTLRALTGPAHACVSAQNANRERILKKAQRPAEGGSDFILMGTVINKGIVPVNVLSSSFKSVGK